MRLVILACLKSGRKRLALIAVQVRRLAAYNGAAALVAGIDLDWLTNLAQVPPLLQRFFEVASLATFQCLARWFKIY